MSTNYTDVIVDAGGRDSPELRSAMCVADMLISPFQPAFSDVRTVGHLVELVRLARGFNASLRAKILVNRTSTNWKVTKAEDAREALEEIEDLQLIAPAIHNRQVFDDAMGAGRGVIEMPDSKSNAKAELEAVATEIYGEQVKIQNSSNAA